VKDTDIIAAIAPDAVSLMDKAIAEIKRLRQENATLTAERDALFVLTDRLTAEHDALRAERDEVRQSYCSLMEAYRGGNGRVTANKLGWGYLFEEDKPCQWAAGTRTRSTDTTHRATMCSSSSSRSSRSSCSFQ